MGPAAMVADRIKRQRSMNEQIAALAALQLDPAAQAVDDPDYDPWNDPGAQDDQSDDDGENILWPLTAALVPLRQWSDVTWLEWQHQTSGNFAQQRNLKYICRYDIVNEDTRDAIVEAVGGLANLDRWPNRRTLRPFDAGFMALLGTPNGQGIGWFLAQHRVALGERDVDLITVWDPYAPTNQPLGGRRLSNVLPTMLFTISAYGGPVPAVPGLVPRYQ